jgi:hypothetical protein
VSDLPERVLQAPSCAACQVSVLPAFSSASMPARSNAVRIYVCMSTHTHTHTHTHTYTYTHTHIKYT